MNNKKRGALMDAINLLDNASDIITSVLDEEQDCLDNMPENLQYSAKYERMEEVIDTLEEAIEQIEEAKDSVEEASK